MTSDESLMLTRLVVREARLIDDGAYEDWLALFAADGSYWIPLRPEDQDPELEPAMLYEDRLLLSVRVERLTAGKAHSLRPQVRCLHVLQQPEIETCDTAAGTARLRTRYVYLETQGDRQVVLGAVAVHDLVREDDGWKIGRKTVHLLNPDAPLPMVQLMP
ncbi:MAG: aromatic-ring-hydroxylating dioxygenase subunit beta [Pigmentiphaga sp.]|nr:aromatic-ring-hydroxylating dioxygenase subunit beta [Pigmentiphaga sp.]